MRSSKVRTWHFVSLIRVGKKQELFLNSDEKKKQEKQAFVPVLTEDNADSFQPLLSFLCFSFFSPGVFVSPGSLLYHVVFDFLHLKVSDLGGMSREELNFEEKGEREEVHRSLKGPKLSVRLETGYHRETQQVVVLTELQPATGHSYNLLSPNLLKTPRVAHRGALTHLGNHLHSASSRGIISIHFCNTLINYNYRRNPNKTWNHLNQIPIDFQSVHFEGICLIYHFGVRISRDLCNSQSWSYTKLLLHFSLAKQPDEIKLSQFKIPARMPFGAPWLFGTLCVSQVVYQVTVWLPIKYETRLLNYRLALLAIMAALVCRWPLSFSLQFSLAPHFFYWLLYLPFHLTCSNFLLHIPPFLLVDCNNTLVLQFMFAPLAPSPTQPQLLPEVHGSGSLPSAKGIYSWNYTHPVFQPVFHYPSSRPEAPVKVALIINPYIHREWVPGWEVTVEHKHTNIVRFFCMRCITLIMDACHAKWRDKSVSDKRIHEEMLDIKTVV